MKSLTVPSEIGEPCSKTGQLFSLSKTFWAFHQNKLFSFRLCERSTLLLIPVNWRRSMIVGNIAFYVFWGTICLLQLKHYLTIWESPQPNRISHFKYTSFLENMQPIIFFQVPILGTNPWFTICLKTKSTSWTSFSLQRPSIVILYDKKLGYLLSEIIAPIKFFALTNYLACNKPYRRAW